MAKRVVLSASPQALGKCSRVAKELSGMLTKTFPNDEITFIRLADLSIQYCKGCNTCKESGECFMEDDMQVIFDALNTSSALYVVAPIYFSGPSANYKAVIDRLQPYFWSSAKEKPMHPAYLIAIGDGGDPHGYEPLIGCTRSGLAVAGFQLVDVQAYIGMEYRQIVDNMARDLFDREG